jgi:hypothetical protein
MSAEFFIVAAALLSLERVCYVLVWRYPEAFGRLCDRFAAPSRLVLSLRERIPFAA